MMSHRRALYKSVLPGSPQAVVTTLLYQCDQIIDDLVLETDHWTLYWTAYDQGLIASLALSVPNATHQVLVSDLKQPRALAIDTLNGYVVI